MMTEMMPLIALVVVIGTVLMVEYAIHYWRCRKEGLKWAEYVKRHLAHDEDEI